MLIGALEAGGTKMVCSIGNPQGGVLQRASFPTLTPDVTVPQIVDFIGKFDVKALGIGSFGPLDLNPASPTYGSITKTPKKEWIQYPLMTSLKDALGVPTGIDTDVNAAALAEYTMGAGKGRGSLLYVTVGTGIGGGLVIDGKMVHGLVHPEMGHMLLAPQEGDSMPDGVCPYHRHCLEGLASGPAIEKRWGLSAKLMTEDHPAWELEATYLAQMCVNMIVTVSPEVIVLGGGVMQQMHLFPKIRERVLKLLGGYVSSPSITPEGIDSYIVPPALGVNSGVIGALLLGALCAAAMLARVSFLERSSGDYEIYLADWLQKLAGGSFAEGMRQNIGEYNVLYQYILFVITRLPVPSLYAVKAVSFIGDAFLPLPRIPL